jgi:hypothetical protein
MRRFLASRVPRSIPVADTGNTNFPFALFAEKKRFTPAEVRDTLTLSDTDVVRAPAPNRPPVVLAWKSRPDGR